MVRRAAVGFGLSLALVMLATAVLTAPAGANPASSQAVNLIGCIPSGYTIGYRPPPCKGPMDGNGLSTGLAPNALGSDGRRVWNIATTELGETDVDFGAPIACPSSTGLALDGAGNLYVANRLFALNWGG